MDIVVALDRTGSMCDNKDYGTNFCTDLDNAKDGVQTLMLLMNPPYAQIGMVAFPPVQTTATSMCDAPYSSGGGFNGYDAPNRGYLTDTINANYRTGSGLNPASGLVLHTKAGTATACVQAGGNTSYSEALRQAQAELLAHGRPNVPNYIVFLTDGEANMGSVYSVNHGTYPAGGPDDQNPCATAISVAAGYKAAGTTIYSIGYALGNKKCTSGEWPYVAEAVPERQEQRIFSGRTCALLRSRHRDPLRALEQLDRRDPEHHVERRARWRSRRPATSTTKRPPAT